ncbi:hypothetical protein F4677DRAFT_450274 [Hypoxylon crocopeplum]|nr:hypothetical protein F4677DRAFT_450274 [Hypoxylon crocopeplum]
MRSHPYTPPPPLPPLLSELSTYLPNRDRKGGASDSEVALSDLDPETSRLLPRKRQKHRVRIQGKLAPVRSVSVVNLRSLSASQRAPSPRDDARLDAAVGGTLSRRRRSEDDMSSEAEDEVEERDTQLRSYGIGGRGNIREAFQTPVSCAVLWLGTNCFTRSAYGCHRDVVEDLVTFLIISILLKLRLDDAVGVKSG